MSRPLVPGPIAEGETDEVFLGVVISRRLRELTAQSSRCAVAVESTEIGACRSIYDHGRTTRAPRELASDCHLLFEKIADPKKTLAEVAPRRGKPVRDYFEYIARNIDLDVLAQVPAYADWVSDARNALKGLGYL